MLRNVKLHKTMGNISILTRVILGCLLIYSGLPKIQRPLDFLSDVYGYHLLGPTPGVVLAMTLPWLELAVGICLVGGLFVGGALLVCVGMGLTFIFAISWALYQGLDISCGCFGASQEKISYLTLIRTCMLLFAAVFAYITFLWQSKNWGMVQAG